MKRNLLLLIAILLLSATGFARTYALVLGISNYQNPEDNVQWTTSAAKKFAQALKAKTSNVSLLTSRNVTRANIMEKLKAIANRAEKDDQIILFYSGHGLEGGLYTFDGVLSYDDIINVLSSSKAGAKYCFIEACHSGSVAACAPNKDAVGARANSNNIMFFTACRPDESAIATGLVGAGGFSQALMKGLQGKADKNRDKKISVIELFEYTYNDVVKRFDSQQHPQLIGPKSMHNNIIITW